MCGGYIGVALFPETADPVADPVTPVLQRQSPHHNVTHNRSHETTRALNSFWVTYTYQTPVTGSCLELVSRQVWTSGLGGSVFEQILETGSSRPLKGRSLGGGGLHIYIYIYIFFFYNLIIPTVVSIFFSIIPI